MTDKSKALAVLSVIEAQTIKARQIERKAANLAAALEQKQGEFWRTCGSDPVNDDLFLKYMDDVSCLWYAAGQEMQNKMDAAAQEMREKWDAITQELDDWGLPYDWGAPCDGADDLPAAEREPGADWGALTDWDALTDWGTTPGRDQAAEDAAPKQPSRNDIHTVDDLRRFILSMKHGDDQSDGDQDQDDGSDQDSTESP